MRHLFGHIFKNSVCFSYVCAACCIFFVCWFCWHSVSHRRPSTWCFDPQQTGFKGNLRLLIKPFEQPHLPFKILSAALHCSTEPAMSCCHLSPHSLDLRLQSKGPNDLLHLALSLCPGEMNHNKKLTCDAHLCTFAVLSVLSNAVMYIQNCL